MCLLLNFNPIIVLFLTALDEYIKYCSTLFQSYYSLIFNLYSMQQQKYRFVFQSYYSLIFNTKEKT